MTPTMWLLTIAIFSTGIFVFFYSIHKIAETIDYRDNDLLVYFWVLMAIICPFVSTFLALAILDKHVF